MIGDVLAILRLRARSSVDRASDFESVRRRFESSRARHGGIYGRGLCFRFFSKFFFDLTYLS